MKRWRIGAALAAAIASAGCDFPPIMSNTGFVGTWSRGNDRNVSILAIVKDGERYRFRWTKRSFDGKYAIVCDWDGVCEERLNGEVQATYQMATRFDPATGKLYTDTVEQRTKPELQTFRYTDEMEVTENGQTLWNYTIARDGHVYEGAERPRRSFSKVADGVADPPDATSR